MYLSVGLFFALLVLVPHRSHRSTALLCKTDLGAGISLKKCCRPASSKPLHSHLDNLLTAFGQLLKTAIALRKPTGLEATSYGVSQRWILSVSTLPKAGLFILQIWNITADTD